jgi:hypothetical protein
MRFYDTRPIKWGFQQIAVVKNHLFDDENTNPEQKSQELL